MEKFVTQFTEKRANIVTDLQTAGISESNILFNRNSIPKAFPAAVVVSNEELGKKKTRYGFVEVDTNFDIYLIVNAHNIADPDTALYQLKEDFRDAYKVTFKDDFNDKKLCPHILLQDI